MSLPPDRGRGSAFNVCVFRPCEAPSRAQGSQGLSFFALALVLALTPPPLTASTPRTFNGAPEDLPLLTEEMAALDPLAAEARCRSFLAALYHRLRTYGANPAWESADAGTRPLDWVLDAFFALPPASPGVRAADAAAGDITRAYLDAFGPAAGLPALPDDPLYRNDKSICEGVLGLARD